MNWLLVPTLLAAVLLFLMGSRAAGSSNFRSHAALQFAVSVVLALPAVFFVLYYGRILGEPVWLYRWRTLPFSEFSASGVGLLAGFLHAKLVPRLKLSAVGTTIMAPGLMVFCIALPYLKPVFRPFSPATLEANWSEGVCLQSSDSTCGPACAATLLKLVQKSGTEEEIAREAFTCKTGTEIWYLARAIKRHGASVRFIWSDPDGNTFHWPAIAGVRLPPENSGHFITLLGLSGTNYIIGDPLIGREVLPVSELKSRYRFTGFFMVVE